MSHEVYKINDPPPKKVPFKLLYITRSKYDHGWHSTSHTHNFTELFYIVQGKGSFLLPNQEIPVTKNDLIMINPNIEHTEKSNTRDFLEYIALGIEGLAFSSSEDDKFPIGLYQFHDDSTNILFYLDKLLDEVKKNQEAYETVCQNIIEIIIIMLQRTKKITIQKTESKNINKAVSFTHHYINRNFRDPITLDTLAEVGHINKYYLAHAFKKDMGIPPIEYLNQVRIKEAKILLESTNYTIAEIAEICGFSSQSFFSQAFKRETGETPSIHRKTHRKILATRRSK